MGTTGNRIVMVAALFLAGLPQPRHIAADLEGNAQSASRSLFVLQVPEVALEVKENETALLPYRFVNQLRLVLHKSSQEIPFGKINTRINGEASNIIMALRSSGTEIICDLDLNYRPGFLLQPGRNAVEVWAESIYGRPFYASFLLDVRDEAQTMREIRAETEVSNPGQRPPVIRLMEPQGPIETVGEIRLAGMVETDAETVSVRVQGKPVEVALDSRPVSQGRRGLRLEVGAKQFWFDVRLPSAGPKDSVEVLAEDARNNRVRLVIPVVRVGAHVVERYAVVVGVSRYTDSRLNLRYAERDAEAIRDFLLDPNGGGVRPGNLLYLVNEAATVSKVRTALNTFLQKPGPQDLVFIYFAGHGAPDFRRPQNLYLLTTETDVNNLGGTAVPMTDILGAYERTIQGRAVTLVDTCHSAGVAQGMQNLTNQGWTRSGFGQGRAVMTASEVNEFSQESDKWGGGHGVFTYFVLQGLRGEADVNRDQSITVGELFDFVRTRVADATGGAQKPTPLAGNARGLVLATRGRGPNPSSQLSSENPKARGPRP